MFALIALGAAVVGGAITSAVTSSGKSKSAEASASARAARSQSPQSYVVTPITSAESDAANSLSVIEAVRRFTV